MVRTNAIASAREDDSGNYGGDVDALHECEQFVVP